MLLVFSSSCNLNAVLVCLLIGYNTRGFRNDHKIGGLAHPAFIQQGRPPSLPPHCCLGDPLSRLRDPAL
jgi:hypothetical protein